MAPDYRRALSILAKLYGLQYTHNPGGGEFWHPDDVRCQVHCQDDKDDFDTVLAWVRENGASVEADVALLPAEQQAILLAAIGGNDGI